ncbi:Hypothetical predicted protein [Paramuricea clavata]|uniref:Uncharacterized protein n=1 Tax=Paramuricea clavata TaxID=317549 RepID=A0A7D9DLV6_PARCT|nr:Hypothetical predicted protein [Paramuricea clavata]
MVRQRQYPRQTGPSSLNWGIAGKPQRGGSKTPGNLANFRNLVATQRGGSATSQLSIKDILLNAAAGVLNKQVKRVKKGVQKRKKKVKQAWLEMGEESGAIQQGSGLPTRKKRLNRIPIVYQYYQ